MKKLLIALLIFVASCNNPVPEGIVEHSEIPAESLIAPVLLNSNLLADDVIFLDFDGHVTRDMWFADGRAIVSSPSTFTTPQIMQVYDQVRSTLGRFDINVTTDSTRFHAAAKYKRQRAIITPSAGWMRGVTGASMTRSYKSKFNNDTPIFVFENVLNSDPEMVGKTTCQHFGRALGLFTHSDYDDVTQLRIREFSNADSTYSSMMGLLKKSRPLVMVQKARTLTYHTIQNADSIVTVTLGLKK